MLGHFWTSFSSIGVLWDSFGSGAELCLNFDSHFDVIFLTFSAFGGCYFLPFFSLFPKPIFPGFYQTGVRLWSQREARERSFASFLGSRRKAEKRRSVCTEHHILAFGTARDGDLWVTLRRLVKEARD